VAFIAAAENPVKLFSTLSPIYTGDYAVHIVAIIDDSILKKFDKSPIKMRFMRLRFHAIAFSSDCVFMRLHFHVIAFSCDCVFMRLRFQAL